jgi:hypothetical protein
MQAPTSFLEGVNKRFRGSTDRWRQVFTLARHARHPLRFSTARRIARSLRPDSAVAIDPAQGFRCFPAGTFTEADELAVAAAQLLEARSVDDVLAKRKGAGRKRFLINVLDAATLDVNHPAVRLALRPDLLAAIAAYMGTVPVLRSIQVFYSGTLDREPTSSQLYHCDADDTRQLKIFVLCSKVESANGPLTMLDATRSGIVRQATGYTFHSRLTDQQVDDALGGPTRATELVGEPGAVGLVDTSRCFHFGSRVVPGAAPRLVTMIQFLSPSAFVLRGDYRSGAAVSGGGDGLAPLQRAVLTGNQDHLSAVRPRSDS